MTHPDYDLCVIGGGINGAAIARDAAGRGLSVLLVEAGDLASATSSASTKLIHGGLRYLEYFQFCLVRESLKERHTLLRAAPHMVRPMEFVLPYDDDLRPSWMIRLGLFIYDRLSGRRNISGSRMIDLRVHEYGSALNTKYSKGFVYSDCQADDARLVVLNALDAQERGAEISTRTACIKLRCDGDRWNISLRDLAGGREWDVRVSMVINAAGPWVRGVLEASDLTYEGAGVPNIRLVKGSHIVVRKRYDGRQSYIVQQKDRRVVFVIPYENDFTLIGTTEVNFEGDPVDVKISESEIDYLCNSYNNAFTDKISAGDIVWSYSGVRALFDNGKGNATAASRDYRLFRHKDMQAPMISVFGGKLTTHRHLAENAVNKILKMAGRPGAAWTSAHVLPGGDIKSFEDFVVAQSMAYPWIAEDLVRRYARTYGTRMDRFLDGAGTMEDLGVHYGDDIYEAEVVYLARYEWAQTVEDILWRRSKMGLRVSPRTVRNLTDAMIEIVEGTEDHDEKFAGY